MVFYNVYGIINYYKLFNVFQHCIFEKHSSASKTTIGNEYDVRASNTPVVVSSVTALATSATSKNILDIMLDLPIKL